MYLILTQCFPPSIGGIEILMGGFAKAIAATGNKLLVLADGKPAAEDGQTGFEVERFSGLKPVRRFLKALRASHVIKTLPIELVIADSWKSLEHLPKLSVPVLCFAYGTEFPNEVDGAKATRIRKAFAKASHILPISHYTADLAAPFIDDQAKVHIFTPPIDAQPEADPVRVAAIRDSYGQAPLILSLSRLEERKGIDQLIAVLGQAPDPKTHLLIAGSGPDTERLKALAAESDYAERIHFLGRVSDADKAAYLAACDLFAMPGRKVGTSVEGFGMAFVEAGWYGKPSVAGLEGGAADAVHDGVTGLLCNGSDKASVSQALNRLLEDQGLRQNYGQAAERLAKASTFAQKIESLLSIAK